VNIDPFPEEGGEGLFSVLVRRKEGKETAERQQLETRVESASLVGGGLNLVQPYTQRGG